MGKRVLAVSDTGVGIKDEALGKIFTRFYREERQQSKADGSGLGLYIASLIVTRHGGRITAAHNRPEGNDICGNAPGTGKGKSHERMRRDPARRGLPHFFLQTPLPKLAAPNRGLVILNKNGAKSLAAKTCVA